MKLSWNKKNTAVEFGNQYIDTVETAEENINELK